METGAFWGGEGVMGAGGWGWASSGELAQALTHTDCSICRHPGDAEGQYYCYHDYDYDYDYD